MSRPLHHLGGKAKAGVPLALQSIQSARVPWPVVWIGSPHPLHRKRVCPFRQDTSGGDTHSLVGSRWGGGSQFRRRDRHYGTLFFNSFSLISLLSFILFFLLLYWLGHPLWPNQFRRFSYMSLVTHYPSFIICPPSHNPFHATCCNSKSIIFLKHKNICINLLALRAGHVYMMQCNL